MALRRPGRVETRSCALRTHRSILARLDEDGVCTDAGAAVLVPSPVVAAPAGRTVGKPRRIRREPIR
ncbi:hypothetical protein ASG43_07035 [Aureimonas sp. Leaf454]|nr:hypothetical protein ASG43_07035 [Aureimonas sp. Leaf454]